jgi:hypothetical protein
MNRTAAEVLKQHTVHFIDHDCLINQFLLLNEA